MSMRSVFRGVTRALPIVVVFFLYGIPFGVVATQVGLPAWATIAMSIFVLGGSAQFAAVQLLAVGAGALDIILATCVLHLRHLMMSASFALRLPAVSPAMRYFLSHTCIDESYAIILGATPRSAPIHVAESVGTMITAWGSWVLATIIGVAIGQGLNDVAALAGVVPIMFAVLLGLAIRDVQDAGVAAVSALFTVGLILVIPGTSQFLLAAILACSLAVCLLPAREGA